MPILTGNSLFITLRFHKKSTDLFTPSLKTSVKVLEKNYNTDLFNAYKLLIFDQ